MQLSQTDYHTGNAFRGYLSLPPAVFNLVTPFLLRDHDKMLALTRDAVIGAAKPQWIKDLPENESAPCIEWSGYLIVPTEKPVGAIPASS